MTTAVSTLLPAVLDMDDERWGVFVDEQDCAVPHHLPAWSHVLEASSGHHCFALCLVDDDRVVRAGMPVHDLRDHLGRRRWEVVPGAVASLPLGPHSDCQRLVREADELRRRAGIRRLDIRGWDPASGERVAGRKPRAVEVREGLNPLQHVATPWASAQVERARRHTGVRSATSLEELQDAGRRLGAPTPRRAWPALRRSGYISALWDLMISRGSAFSVLVHDRRDNPLALAVCLVHKQTAALQHSITAPSELAPIAAVRLYDAVLRELALRRCKVLHLPPDQSTAAERLVLGAPFPQRTR